MNTSQRNIIRIVCYVLAGLIGLALLAADQPLVGAVIAIVLVGLGKIVWAGRPLGHIGAFVGDVVEIDRAITPKPQVKKPSSE
jgi:hypothetical protein